MNEKSWNIITRKNVVDDGRQARIELTYK